MLTRNSALFQLGIKQISFSHTTFVHTLHISIELCIVTHNAKETDFRQQWPPLSLLKIMDLSLLSLKTDKSRIRKLYDSTITIKDCVLIETYIKFDFNQMLGQENKFAKKKYDLAGNLFLWFKDISVIYIEE